MKSKPSPFDLQSELFLLLINLWQIVSPSLIYIPIATIFHLQNFRISHPAFIFISLLGLGICLLLIYSGNLGGFPHFFSWPGKHTLKSYVGEIINATIWTYANLYWLSHLAKLNPGGFLPFFEPEFNSYLAFHKAFDVDMQIVLCIYLMAYSTGKYLIYRYKKS